MSVEDKSQLIRQNLSLLDKFDVDKIDKEMTEGERRSYCARISEAYDILEKDIVRGVYEQMVLTMSSATNMDEITLGQGSINGMNVLLERWQRAKNEHEDNIKPEEVDEHNPLPEI